MHSSVARFGWLMALSTAFVAGAFVHGCGSDETTPVDPGGVGGDANDAGEDVSVDGEPGSDVGPDGPGVDVKPDCELVGATCASHSDCCSATCDLDTNSCINPPTECKVAGTSCTLATECCTTVCSGGKCGDTVCTSDNEACVAGDECCSGKCATAPDAAGATCLPLNPLCGTVGNGCAEHSDCCSKYCLNDRCSGSPSFCTQTGDACSEDQQCCAGICLKEDGAPLGLCRRPNAPGVPGGCLFAGDVCGAGAVGDPDPPVCGGECCSRSCAPYGPTGVLICQPPSGCRPTGEACKTDADCCGSAGMPGGNGSVTCSKNANEDVGRCDNGNACRPAGAICKLATSSCNAENNCCAGNVNTDPTVCQQDLLGIPRCTGVGNCDPDAGTYIGKECATSADCCGLPCLPNADPDGPTFICGDSCVPAGGSCTTDADCCAGLPCHRPAGSSEGTCGNIPDPDAGVPDADVPDGETPDATCALWGQECTTAADCCNEVPCTNGRCYEAIF